VRNSLGPLINIVYAANEDDAQEYAKDELFDLIVIDLNLAGFNGYSLIDLIGENYKGQLNKFIVLTGSQEVADEVKGHNLGILDYIKKPFNAEVLRAVVEKHLRIILTGTDNIINRGNLVVDLGKMDAEVKDIDGLYKDINLTAKEFKILKLLMDREGQIISRSSIYENIWDTESDSLLRTVDMHISSLRKKLTPLDNYIKTIRSFGYKFEPQQMH
jgi:DNA-binding response OmpR family regulator